MCGVHNSYFTQRQNGLYVIKNKNKNCKLNLFPQLNSVLVTQEKGQHIGRPTQSIQSRKELRSPCKHVSSFRSEKSTEGESYRHKSHNFPSKSSTGSGTTSSGLSHRGK